MNCFTTARSGAFLVCVHSCGTPTPTELAALIRQFGDPSVRGLCVFAYGSANLSATNRVAVARALAAHSARCVAFIDNHLPRMVAAAIALFASNMKLCAVHELDQGLDFLQVVDREGLLRDIRRVHADAGVPMPQAA